MTDLVASLILKFTDLASGPAGQASKKIIDGLKQTGQAAKDSAAAGIISARALANARETLGIRSENAIQIAIRQTQTAYQDLERSGKVSARELSRAQDVMREKVAALRRELEGVKGSASVATKALAVMGAYQAGKAVLSGPVGQTMSYDRQLANLSNTAYAGQSMDARRAGMRTLDAAITTAVRQGGGTREGALGTLDKLVASGAFTDANEAAKLLPILTKAGTASNADPAQLADIAIRAKQTFGLTDTGLALDQAIKAGQLGGFELKDMAKWLPQQMAMARQSGMKGDDGFRALLAANQAVAITAGTKDEAGNNLVNLLAKINSQDTAKDAQKLGINLSGSLAAAREKGTNSLDAFVNLVDQVVGKDKNYQALKEKAKGAKGDDQKAAYESMGDILQGSSIGKIIQDRQALMALVGIMNNRDYMKDIYAQTGNAKGTGADNFGLIAETPSFKAEQLAAEKAISMQKAMDSINPALGGMADGLVSIMREWPLFSAAILGATTALAALAAAAGAASLAQVLTGGKVGMLGGLGARAATLGRGALGIAAGAGGWLAGLGGGGAIGAMLSTGGVAAAGAAGYGAGSLLNAGINWGVGKMTGGKEDSFGGWLYELLHQEKQPQKLEVEVSVKNGNLVAEVNKANARQAARN